MLILCTSKGQFDNRWQMGAYSGFKKEFSCNPETQVLISSLLKLLPDFYFK